MAPMILESTRSQWQHLKYRADKASDAKRKAIDPPDDLAAIKRIKNSHTASPEAEKKKIKVVPFAEKVKNPCCNLLS